MSDERPTPPWGGEPTQPVPQAGHTQPISPSPTPPPPPGGSVPPPGSGYPPPGGPVPPPGSQYPPLGQSAAPGQYPAPPGYQGQGHQQPSGRGPGWSGSPTYRDYRPGTIPLRPLTMSDIFGGVVATIRGNLAATLGLGLLVTAIATIPTTALGIWWARSGSLDLEGLNRQQNVEFATGVGSLLPNLAQALGVLLTAAFMVWVIGQGAIGRRVTPGQVWTATRGRLPAVVGVVLLTALLVLVPMFVLVLIPIITLATSDGSGAGAALFLFFAIFAILFWVIFLWVRTAFATSAVVLEEAGPLTALKRSFALTKGAFWRIFGIRFLAGIALAIVSTIITLPITQLVNAVSDSSGGDLAARVTAGIFASALGTLIAGILTTPFSAGVDALLYVDQRMRKEGLDVSLMRAAQGQDR